MAVEAEDPGVSRRAFIAAGVGSAALLAVGVNVQQYMYERIRWGEDFFPGTPPTATLEPQAWTITDDAITFAVLGDNGSGGRNAMAVATQMVDTYQQTPYGLVLLAGDISYYGSIDDRYEEVFAEPYGPLIEAGVSWELAIGNHEISEQRSDDAKARIEAQLRRLGKPGTYYSEVYGPIECFMLDSSGPGTGEGGPAQLAWLEQALAQSTARWKVVTVHHPMYSSGQHGSSMRVRDAIEDVLVDGGVDVVFCGHDHHYERTHPQRGITHILSGAGSKLSRVGRSEFTAFATSELQFMLVEVDGDVMDISCIGTEGQVIDHVALQPREQ